MRISNLRAAVSVSSHGQVSSLFQTVAVNPPSMLDSCGSVHACTPSILQASRDDHDATCRALAFSVDLCAYVCVHMDSSNASTNIEGARAASTPSCDTQRKAARLNNIDEAWPL